MSAPPPRSFDVCVRGAGVVGAALALLLARARLRVALVSRVDPAHAGTSRADHPAVDVRAYAMNAASKTLLEGLRAWPDAAGVGAVTAMRVHGDGASGAQAADRALRFDAASQDAQALAWIVDVPALESRLADALRFQPLVERVGEPVAAALTVVCEGRASQTRDAYGVTYTVTPYAQSAIAARLRAAVPHGGVARQWFGPHGDVLALLPLADPHALALVWSLAQATADETMALDAAAFCARLSDAAGGAVRAGTGTLALTSEREAWPLQRAIADRWTGPGWALAGDAAHTVHPLAGQGLNLGLADAAELTRTLERREYWRGVGDPKLLRRYERARKGDVLAMGWATDGLQRLFAQPQAPLAWLRNAGLAAFDASGPLKRWAAARAMGTADDAGAMTGATPAADAGATARGAGSG